jgi:hypothetical protein
MILQRCGVVDCCFGFQLKCVLSPATVMAKLPTHRKSLFWNRNNSTINRQHRKSVTQVMNFGFWLIVSIVVALFCPSLWSRCCDFVVVRLAALRIPVACGTVEDKSLPVR